MESVMPEAPAEYSDLRHLFLPPPGMSGDIGRRGRAGPAAGPVDRRFVFREDRDRTVIVYPPTIDWCFMKQRPQHLMEQFALHGHQVFYCNKTQSTSRCLQEVLPNLTLVHDNRTFIRDVIPALKEQGKKVLLWVSWSKLHLFVDQYRPDFVVYDYVDDIPEWARYLHRMAERADVIVTTALILQQHIDRFFPEKPSYLIPNGCDVQHFRRFGNGLPERPPACRGHEGPIIGYVGAWAYWVDHDLVREITHSFPEALFCAVGVEYGVEPDRSIPNLRHVGHQPYEVLPQYLYHFDVCVIPFQVNRVTVATNPIKMYEYLAAGKPVVATDLPEARNVPGVWVGEDHASFIGHLRRLLSSPVTLDREEVDRWLASRTWERRYRSIIDMLNDF